MMSVGKFDRSTNDRRRLSLIAFALVRYDIIVSSSLEAIIERPKRDIGDNADRETQTDDDKKDKQGVIDTNRQLLRITCVVNLHVDHTNLNCVGNDHQLSDSLTVILFGVVGWCHPSTQL
jgi:hypothetical protein